MGKLKVLFCFVIAIYAVLFLSACSIAPPEVTPSISLINKTGSYSEYYLANDISQKISTSNNGDVITSGSSKVKVGKPFISAMGLECKYVQLHKDEKIFDTSACLGSQGWFFSKPLMHDSAIKL